MFFGEDQSNTHQVAEIYSDDSVCFVMDIAHIFTLDIAAIVISNCDYVAFDSISVEIYFSRSSLILQTGC